MNTFLEVSEIFDGIQGEGKFAGQPVIFIRCSKCTRNCSFCDTKYHADGEMVSIKRIAKGICNQNLRTIVVTGGEPTLQMAALISLWQLVNKEKHFHFHLETNGDFLYAKKVSYSELFSIFSYVAISPKEPNVAKRLYKDLAGPISKGMCDIKIVTDLETVGIGMLRYASILMPLTTKDPIQDLKIQQRVWKRCLKRGVRYSPRLHVDLFGYNKRGI